MLDLAADWFCLSRNKNPKMPLVISNKDNWAILQLLILDKIKFIIHDQDARLLL